MDLITVLPAILTGRQSVKNLQCLYADPMSNNFCLTLALKIYELRTEGSGKGLYKPNFRH